MLGARTALLVALVACAPPALARAQEDPLATGLAQYREGRLRDALVSLETAVRGELPDREALVTARLHLGLLHAALGDEARAGESFAMACALRPGLEAPAELRPALRRVFDEACTGARALEVDARASDAGLVVRVQGGAPGLASQVRARAGGEVVARAPLEAAEQTLVVPDLGVAHVVEVLAEGGTVIASAEVAPLARPRAEVAVEVATDPGSAALVPVHAPEGALTADPPQRDRGPDVEPWVWVVIGVAVAGGIAGAIAGGVIASEQQPSGIVLSMPEIVP